MASKHGKDHREVIDHVFSMLQKHTMSKDNLHECRDKFLHDEAWNIACFGVYSDMTSMLRGGKQKYSELSKCSRLKISQDY